MTQKRPVSEQVARHDVVFRIALPEDDEPACFDVYRAMIAAAGPARSLLVAVFSWVAEQERRRLSERTIAGMERARANGLHIGRPRAAVNVTVLRELLSRDGATQELVAGELGVSVSSIQRVLRRDRREPLFKPRSESPRATSVDRKEVAGRRANAPGRGPRRKGPEHDER